MSPKGEAVSENHMADEWFILKGENQIGPFSYEDVVRMLQSKEAFGFDLVWKNGWADWMRIAEAIDFSADRVRTVEKALTERSFDRAPLSGTVLVHNNHEIWRGKGLKVSEGGAGILVQSSTLIPGDQVLLHFRPQGDMPAFNVKAEVVNKMWNGKVRTKQAVIRYDFKFLNPGEDVVKALKALVRGGLNHG